jgi:hypothetical protein
MYMGAGKATEFSLARPLKKTDYRLGAGRNLLRCLL